MDPLRHDVLQSSKCVARAGVVRQMRRVVPQRSLDPGDEARRVAGLLSSPFRQVVQERQRRRRRQFSIASPRRSPGSVLLETVSMSRSSPQRAA